MKNLSFDEKEDKPISVEAFKDLQQKKIKIEGRASVLEAMLISKRKELEELLGQLPKEVPKDTEGLRNYLDSLKAEIFADTNKLASILSKAEEEINSFDT